MIHRIDELVHDKDDREILRSKLIDGKTLQEIADMQNRPFSTVRDHYYTMLRIIFGNDS